MPDGPVPLSSVAEADDPFHTVSTHVGALSEGQDDGSSEVSAPEWTPRESGPTPTSYQRKRADDLDSSPQPPWVKMSEYASSKGSSAPEDTRLGCSSNKTPRRSGTRRPSSVPKLPMPLMFDIYTARESRQQTSPELYHSPTYPEHGPSGSVDDNLSAVCSSEGGPTGPNHLSDRLRVGIPEEWLTDNAASPRLDDARREVAAAHVELLARAAELRRREKRLKRLERQGSMDKENIDIGHAMPDNTSFVQASPSNVTFDRDCKYTADLPTSRQSTRGRDRDGHLQASGRDQDRHMQGRVQASPSSVTFDRDCKYTADVPTFSRQSTRCRDRDGHLQASGRDQDRHMQGSGPLPTIRSKTCSPRRDSSGGSRMASRRVIDLSPPEMRTPREHQASHEFREVRLRRSEPQIASVDDDGRRAERRKIKVLQRRLRRRAEEAATSMWRNSLLIAAAVSLCVAGVTALAVALAIRR